ncbi:uncharacterized protein ARMOST_13846 [Armillaria ostoyae]|uniref:Retrotransposon gag domain-containing protein n=1 Tax=Armillaria ostoyae TaxID=47428 RepID=A0A284RNX8_ARMOS|nr:uncharacterized protein ARMOST_13846 [Armillaria ostoyae]
MSQQLTEHPGQQPSSPHSSHLSLQDYPLLPMSKTLDRRGDTSSMKSTKKSLQSRILFFWKKGSEPLAPQTTYPAPKPGPQTLETSQKPLGPALPPSSPLLTYDELLQQVAMLWQEKSSCDSLHATTRSREPSPTTEPSWSSTATQQAQDWQWKQADSIGDDNTPIVLKPTPSMRLTPRPTVSILSSSSRSGSSNTDSIERTKSSKDSLESLSLHGWSSERTLAQEMMTPKEREHRYTNIWCSRRVTIPTEVTWMHSEAGQAWKQADPAEQEDIIITPIPCLLPISPDSSNTHSPKPHQSPPTSRDADVGQHHPRFTNEPKACISAQADNQAEQMKDEEDDDKGKKLEKLKNEPWQLKLGFFKGDKPPDHYADPVAWNMEQWSLPGAPNKFDPEYDPPNPIGAMGEDVPWIGCKPDLIRKPLPFLGDADDINRFIMDCQMYFQVHSAYMWLDPYRVAFAFSYFEGRAKDWWTLQLAELYSTSRGKYRFPTWYAFKQAIEEKFKDPSVKDKQKVTMYALCMTGSMTTTEYFQEVEKFTKKARLWSDINDRGHMVTALCQGVPASYTSMIANIRIGIPVGYDQWKDHIETMNKERQRKQALNSIGEIYQSRPQQNRTPQQNTGDVLGNGEWQKTSGWK